MAVITCYVTAVGPWVQESVSNFVPLWAGCFDITNQTLQHSVLNALTASGLVHVAGIATTLEVRRAVAPRSQLGVYAAVCCAFLTAAAGVFLSVCVFYRCLCVYACVRVYSIAQTTGQQWDFPNAWPPSQHFVITGLLQSTSQELQDYGVSQCRVMADPCPCSDLKKSR